MTTLTQNIATATALTHGGVFHADEIMATVILSKVLGDINVARVFSVPEDVSESVIIYDVGYGKYDHHQRGGNGCRENGVPYAAAGLIWQEFGRQLVADTCNPELVWSIIDRELIQGIDALDNGALPKADYPAQAMSVSQIISGFNPNWDSSEASDVAFAKAVDFATVIFDNLLANAVSRAKGQQIVDEAIEASTGNIMVLDRFVPWQEFIFASASEKAADVQFVIFPSNRGGFNWQCVPDCLGGFGQRKPVPASWKGLRGSELQEVTGIATAIFCHPAGFMGSAETFDDALAMARLAVKA